MAELREEEASKSAVWEESLREALATGHSGTALLREIYWASKITLWSLSRSVIVAALSAAIIFSPFWWLERTSLANKPGLPLLCVAAISACFAGLTIFVKPFKKALLPTSRLLPYQIQLIGKMIAAGVKCTDRMRNRLAEEIVTSYIGAPWIGQTLQDIGISEEKTIRSIRKRLGHKDWQVRHDCLVALAASKYRSDEVLADFAWLLNDHDENVRRAAVTGLGMLGGPEEKTEELVRKCLSDTSREVRFAAIATLSRTGFKTSETLGILGQLAIDKDAGVREASRQLLVNSGAHEKLVVTMLIKLLAQPGLGEANVRFVAEVLDTVGKSSGFVSDSLTRVLRHGSTEHRRAVSRALEFIEIRDIELVKALAERIRDDDEECRHVAAQTMIGKAKTDDRFMPILAAQLECGGVVESSLAGYILVQTGLPSPRAIAVFKKWAASEDFEKRRDGLIALSLLQPLDETVVSKVCLGLIDESEEVAGTSLQLLQQMPQSHVFIARALTRMLKDSRVQARRVAIETIGKVLKPRIRSLITHICEAFDDPDESVRVSAIRTIAEARVKSGKIKDALFLKMTDASDDVRHEAMEALESLGFTGSRTPVPQPFSIPSEYVPASQAGSSSKDFDIRNA